VTRLPIHAVYSLMASLRNGGAWVVGTLALLGTGSCSEPTQPCSYPSFLAVEVAAGTTPTFHWKPRCLVGDISLVRLDTTAYHEVWYVRAPNNDVASGITFGSRGTLKGVLQTGASYRIRVGVIVEGDASATLGQSVFSP
jgi:hypothetical protein